MTKIPNRSAISYSRLISSCMLAAVEPNFSAAPLAAMLSVSIITLHPANRWPYKSITRTMPNNSRKLIGRRVSARVNCMLHSSLCPSSQTTVPTPQSDASVPASMASHHSGSSIGTQFRTSR